MIRGPSTGSPSWKKLYLPFPPLGVTSSTANHSSALLGLIPADSTFQLKSSGATEPLGLGVLVRAGNGVVKLLGFSVLVGAGVPVDAAVPGVGVSIGLGTAVSVCATANSSATRVATRSGPEISVTVGATVGAGEFVGTLVGTLVGALVGALGAAPVGGGGAVQAATARLRVNRINKEVAAERRNMPDML